MDYYTVDYFSEKFQLKMLPTALFCMLTLTSAVPASPNKKMEVLYHWKSVDFLFPNDRMRKQMISTGQFVPGNSIPLDVDTWQKGNEAG